MKAINPDQARLLLRHVHNIGMSLTSLETELQGSHANTTAMYSALNRLREGLNGAQQEIIALRDTEYQKAP